MTICNECSEIATVKVTFTSKNPKAVDVSLCDKCLESIGKRYKSDWAGSQICISEIK